jgi:hypothetical protein
VVAQGRHRRTLAFDIETTGLKPKNCQVTVICTEDFFTGDRRAYEFAKCDAEDGNDKAKKRQKLIDDLIKQFDAATSLCAFNGVRFDLPFMRTALDIEDETVARWVLKTSDILEQSRLLYRTTFSLNLLCQANMMAQKTGDGLHAIEMARKRDFDGLREYCADDVRILCDMYRKQYILLPKLNQTQDLAEWAHPDLYQAMDDKDTEIETGGTEEFMSDQRDTVQDRDGKPASDPLALINDLLIEVDGSLEPSGKDLAALGEVAISPNILKNLRLKIIRLKTSYLSQQAQHGLSLRP